jgi:hypothetical protein
MRYVDGIGNLAKEPIQQDGTGMTITFDSVKDDTAHQDL